MVAEPFEVGFHGERLGDFLGCGRIGGKGFQYDGVEHGGDGVGTLFGLFVHRRVEVLGKHFLHELRVFGRVRIVDEPVEDRPVTSSIVSERGHDERVTDGKGAVQVFENLHAVFMGEQISVLVDACNPIVERLVGVHVLPSLGTG